MFERFTEKFRRAIFFSRYEASQKGSESIGPEHILLGLVREYTFTARRFGLNSDSISRKIPGCKKDDQSVDLPFSLASSLLFERATEIADQLAVAKTVRDHTGTPEILLAMVRLQNEPGFETLAECLKGTGATKEAVEQWYAERPKPQSAEMGVLVNSLEPRRVFEGAIRAAFATAAPGLANEAHTLHVLTSIANDAEVQRLLGSDNRKGFALAVYDMAPKPSPSSNASEPTPSASTLEAG